MTPPRAIKDRSKLTKDEWREYTKTVWHIANTTHRGHPAVFPVEIPRRLIKLFTFHGELVLDPFAGIGTTAVAALELGRRAVCVEQSGRYVEILLEECRPLLAGGDESRLRVVRADSRNLDFIADSSIDLIVTSPPYWNKANYGGDQSNLGGIARYSAFLSQAAIVFAECRRLLRPGRKLCVVTANVNQHTDHGLVSVPLAADFVAILRGLGLVMINEVIWAKDGTGGKWGSWGAQRPIFGSYPYPPNFLFKNLHEYILIFAKPAGRKVRGPKVVSYASVVAT